MYYLSKRNYAKANLVQNKKINNFEFKILIANDKSEFIAVVESNQTLDENVKNRELKSLKSINDNYEKTILSLDSIFDNVSNEGIKCKNIISFLLE